MTTTVSTAHGITVSQVVTGEPETGLVENAIDMATDEHSNLLLMDAGGKIVAVYSRTAWTSATYRGDPS